MRIGPKEREILLRLIPGEFVPPSVYLGDYGRCPSGYTVHRLIEKKLAVFQYQTWSHEELVRRYKNPTTRPGRETAEVNAAMMPTKEGEAVIEKLRTQAMKKEKHEWMVFSTALAEGWLMLYCKKTGATGTVRDPSREEWSEAFTAPSAPYPWLDEDRVVIDQAQ